MRRLLGLVLLLGILTAAGVIGLSVIDGVPPVVDKPVAQDKDNKAPPLDLIGVRTGAVVDLSQSPVGALFEAKMLAGKKLTWVERTHVDKVLAELELQALFSPEGGSKRVGLGKLLKADLLILLRAGESSDDKKIKHLQIVVCESKYGLRLATDAVTLTGNADVQFAALEAVLDGALAKVSEKITDVCAVPPFICNDLDYKYDYLKAAYARVLENHLLQRKGILLIELAEAQAIAKEAALAGGAKVERWLPLYFFGAFRNEGKGDERRVEFDLKVQRGDQTVGSKEKVPISPQDAPKHLGKLADELADKVLIAGAGGVLDAKAEIQQLLSRAGAFEQLGNWRESLAMLETALLLDPNQPDVNLRASHAGAMVTLREIHGARSGKPELGVPALRTYRRALEHLELSNKALVKQDPPRPPPSKSVSPAPSMEFMLATFTIKNLNTVKPLSDERTALYQEVMAEERERYLRLTRLRARAGAGDEHNYLRWATESLPKSERFPMIRDMILELKDLPLARERTIAFMLRGFASLYDPGEVALAHELAKSPHAPIRAACEELLKGHAAFMAKLKEKPPAPKATLPNAELRLVPIELKHREFGRAHIWNIKQWVAAGPNLDFFFSGSVVYMMKDKGIIDPIWSTPELNVRPHRSCYDGRYLWFWVNRDNKTSLLLVADPKTLRTWEFTAADGLPRADPDGPSDKSKGQNIDMAPLGPGRVCLVGSFGRTWIAIATFDPDHGKSVKIFHEAREPAAAKQGEQWRNTKVAFEPSNMHVLTGAKGERRVVIGRLANDYTAGVQQHPLLVNPETLTVEVMKEKISLFGRHGQVRDGAVYYVGPGVEPKKTDFVKFEFPAVRTSLLTDVPYGRWSVFVNDDLHIVTSDKQWWHGSVKEKQFRNLGTIGDGELDHVGLSSHYGLFILYQSRPHQVRLRSDPVPVPVAVDPPPIKPKNPDPMPKGDPRLDVMIRYPTMQHGSLDEVLDVLTRLTKVRFTLADPPKDGKVMAFEGFLGFGRVSENMARVAERCFTDGKWQKEGDGYVLVGKPRIVWTPKDFTDAAARQKAAKEANVTLKNDERLNVRVKYNMQSDLPLEEALDIIRKAAKIPVRLTDSPKDGKPLGVFTSGDAPIWKLMQSIADYNIFEGKWEKDGDGYKLLGRPKRIITPKDETEAAAKKKAFDEAVARTKAFSLRIDSKLQAKFTVKEINPKLPDLLKRMEEASGLRFVMPDNLIQHDPTFGSLQLQQAMIWMYMELIARADLENGKWIKIADGYRLEGISISSRPAPKNAQEAERLWKSLTDSPDPREPERAIRGLAAAPDVTLAFFKVRVQPVKGPDQKRFTEFRNRLHCDDNAVSEPARKELLTMELNEGTYGILDLAAANDFRLKRVLVEVKARLDKLGAIQPRGPAFYAAKVLERIGNAEAKRQLETLATGAFGASLNHEAQAALQRLQKSNGAK